MRRGRIFPFLRLPIFSFFFLIRHMRMIEGKNPQAPIPPGDSTSRFTKEKGCLRLILCTNLGSRLPGRARGKLFRACRPGQIRQENWSPLQVSRGCPVTPGALHDPSLPVVALGGVSSLTWPSLPSLLSLNRPMGVSAGTALATILIVW